MSQRPRQFTTRTLVRTGLALATVLFPLSALAQDAPPTTPAETTPAEPAPAPAEPTMAAAEPAPPAPAPEVSVSAETAPPAAEDDGSGKPLSVSVWGRIGNVLNNPNDPEKLDDASMNAEVDLLLSGQIHKYVKWQANFVATYGGDITGDAQILDLIGQFEFAEAFNVWFGRMLVPSDRSNFSGPWFMAPWNYPGFFTAGPPFGPRQGPFGRNDGVTAWGGFGGGLFKYYLSAFDLHNAGESPLYSARLNLALINPEPGFYHSSTYYGGKDIFAIGVSAQYKKDGSVQAVMAPAPGMMAPVPLTDNYTGFSADVLFEKNLGGAGVVDVEGAFYSYTGDYEALKYSFFALASYLTPSEIGIGKLQPLVRYQGGKPETGDMWSVIDAQVGYVIKDYAARLALGYSRIDVGGAKSNAAFLGIQLQK